jgi:cytochrome c-type biogenesis protein CcmH
MQKLIISIFFIFFIQTASTQPIAYSEQERVLFEQIRCLVCQNQSLADSQAPLAVDLKREISLLVNDGYDDNQIFQYLTDRYGDFVLYKPRFTAVTFLLWSGPFIMLLIAFFVFIRILRQSAKG